VLGNFIGTNAAGDAALGNAKGIEIGGSNNTIGGTGTAARNLISGNTGDGVFINTGGKDNQVLGNYIGTEATGSFALANDNGIEVADSNNTIGGTASGARNLISGNSDDGVLIDSSSSGNQVLGNYIGMDATGDYLVSNYFGVEIDSSDNTIGGTAAGARNLMSGNTYSNVYLIGSGNQVLGNYIGTNAAGNAGRSNFIGIDVGWGSSSNTIGGTTSGARNLISGNSGGGIIINGNGNQVLGNFVGTNPTGNAAVANRGGIGVEGNSNTIGGTVSGAGNIIAGNFDSGIYLDGNGNQVLGNFVGTNAAGNAALANHDGIFVAGTGNMVGGTVSGARNIIAGNSDEGLDLSGQDNEALGNFIGTDVTGKVALPNSIGVEMADSNDTVGGTASGAGNVISGNSNQGVLFDRFTYGNQVVGNYIGINAAGTTALANSIGIEDAGNHNTLGGTTSAARNIISGNSSDGVLLTSTAIGNQVLGDYIGTNAAGKAAVANSVGVELVDSNSTIGGTASGAGNLISGNRNQGVLIDSSSSDNQVLGNFIGTNAAGNAALGNDIGVEMVSSNNTIGGTASGAGNLISGNSQVGVFINIFGTGNQVLGNSIGTNAAGKAAVANNVGVEVAGSSNTVGGATAGSRNVISGNTGYGIKFDATASGVLVAANYVGTNSSGKLAVANGIGIEIDGSFNTIGGTTSATRNLISGNSNQGLLIYGSDTQVMGNSIGTDSANVAELPNALGIEVQGNNNTIGGSVAAAGNAINFNKKGGVLVSTGTWNTISQNSIFANGSAQKGPGITLSGGANNSRAAPKIISATLSGNTLTVTGTFTATTANASYVLEFFANSSGDAEGRYYLGSLTVTPTSTGTQSFTFTATDKVSGVYLLVTATLTDPSGNTSAFANGVNVGSPKGGPPPSSPPPSSPPPSSSSSSPTLSPVQMALEVALDTAALVLRDNALALLQLNSFSMALLGQNLPPSDQLLANILSDVSGSEMAGFLGLEQGLSIADSVQKTTT
jgi:titin